MAKYSMLSPKTGNKARMSTLTTMQHITEGPNQCNRERNKKGIDLKEINENVSIHREYDFFHEPPLYSEKTNEQTNKQKILLVLIN